MLSTRLVWFILAYERVGGLSETIERENPGGKKENGGFALHWMGKKEGTGDSTT